MPMTLFAAVQAELDQIEGIMQQALADDEPRVMALLDNLGEFHGKMLRPAMLLLMARCCGATTPAHLHLAAAVEMIHTATLIHDDIIDDGRTRRGEPTVHRRFGNSVAVLLGDYFYTHAFDLVAGLGQSAWTRQLTAVTNQICRGELHQMCARYDASLDEDEYFRIIEAKTAALCDVSCVFGAAQVTASEQRAAAAFGRACGYAFQIVDDCLDLVGTADKIGKTLATDVENGRFTLPIIRLLAGSPVSERTRLSRQLLAVRSAEDIAAIQTLVRERGAIDAAMTTARAYADEACAHARHLPAGPHRQVLVDLATFIVARDF
jgi:octaprenyl-diphosphate synthase